MTISSKNLADLLQEFAPERVKVRHDKMPVNGRVALVTMQPGPGFEMEGIIDVLQFNLQVRGGENNVDDAEQIARQFDHVICHLADTGVIEMEEFGSISLIYEMGRTGGGPAKLNVSDASSRYAFTCNYWARVSTEIGVSYGD